MSNAKFNKSNANLDDFLKTRKNENDFIAIAYSNAGNSCQFCGGDGDHCHHIIPRSMGGEHKLINLIILCKKCHLKAHNGDFFNHNGLNEVMQLYFQKINDERYAKSIPEMIQYFEVLKNQAYKYQSPGSSKKSMFYYAGKSQAYEEVINLLLKLEH